MSVAPHPLSAGRTVLGLATLVGGVALMGGAVVGVAAGVGAVWHATNPSSGVVASRAAAAAAPSASSVTVKIEDVKTAGGTQPAYVGPNGVGSPTLFQVDAGTPTTVTIVNNDSEPHTFTASALGLNVTVPPGPSTVHFTVDAKSPGLDTWDCAVPCGAWAMGHPGYMQGDVKVVG